MAELPMVEERAERCETCRFWDASHRAELALDGECKAHPPVPQFDAKGFRRADEDKPIRLFVETFFPQTYGDDWCGEWQKASGSVVEE